MSPSLVQVHLKEPHEPISGASAPQGATRIRVELRKLLTLVSSAMPLGSEGDLLPLKVLTLSLQD